jgi:hypothetical protein
VAATALERFRRSVARDPWPDIKGDNAGVVARDWAAALAIYFEPQAAGRVACDALERGHILRDDEMLGIAVARGGTRCAAVRKAVEEQSACGYKVRCGDRLCSAAEVRSMLDHWAIRLLASENGLRPSSAATVPADMALLAAAYAQGPLPRAFIACHQGES